MPVLANLRNLWNKSRKNSRFLSRALKAQLCVETLESRLVPYSVSGNAWPHPELVTISFTPDGTSLGGGSSNLQSTFDNHPNSSFRANWRKEVLRAAQVWAQQTNLNFALVSDNGAAAGSGLYQQGDPGFGDVRIGGMNLGAGLLSTAYLPPPVNNYSIAGDINFNTAQAFNINSTYDLFTAAVHEFGHSLGLYHNDTQSNPVMYGYYVGIKSSLRPDDINGIRNIYSSNLVRSKDAYDLAASNDSFATASSLTPQIDDGNLTALVQNLDLTTTSDVDYYTFTAPANTNGTMTVKAQSSGLSMLKHTLTVYAADQTTVLDTASGARQYGSTLSVTVNGVAPSQQFYVKVANAEPSAFGTGKYALTLNFGGNPNPTVPLPNTQTANGNPLSGGGGQPTRVDFETTVNTTSAGEQKTSAAQAVAMDAAGNYVAVWMSKNQDGDGWGVYARRFNKDGIAQGDEFRVNTTTSGDQNDPAVAMDDAGNFVVAWASYGQGNDDDDDGSWDVYAQRFNAAGVPQGTEFRVNTTTSGDQKKPSVAIDADGDFVIVWADSAQDGNGWGIFGQRYNAAGVAQGSEFLVNTVTANDQNEPAVAMDDAGNFVVAYTNNGQDGSGLGVYARTFDTAGASLLSEFQVNAFTADYQKSPAVAMDNSGGFVIAWSSKNQDGDGWGVYARRFNLANGTAGDEFRVNTTTANDQEDAGVAMDSAGNFIVTWASKQQDGDSWGVFARHYDSTGAAVGGELLVNTTTDGNQRLASVAMDDYGRVVMVWSGNGIGDADGVFAQRYSISGGEGIGDGIGDGCCCPACQAAAEAAAEAVWTAP